MRFDDNLVPESYKNGSAKNQAEREALRILRQDGRISDRIDSDFLGAGELVRRDPETYAIPMMRKIVGKNDIVKIGVVTVLIADGIPKVVRCSSKDGIARKYAKIQAEYKACLLRGFEGK